MNALISLSKTTGEDVYVQAGNTPIPANGPSGAAFLQHDELIEKIKSASLVVSQGGFGSIRDVLREQVPLVVVPRLEALGEEKGDQTVLVKALEERGSLIAVFNIEELPAAVEAARTRSTVSPPTSTIPTQLTELVDFWQVGS